MNCPHCGIAFHDEWETAGLRLGFIQTTDPEGVRTHVTWSSRSTVCPSCRNATIDLRRLNNYENESPIGDYFRVYPQNTFRKPTPKEVPGDIKEDYEEACKVLNISNKASAALSRRCLQAVLRGRGYSQKDLAPQIDALLNEPDPTKAIPTALRQTVDAIRNFGNFSAHPMTDKTSLQIIPVDEGEADWCLDILEEMFDHYYVKPKQAADRKAALDAKLAAAGKPPSKS